MKKMKTPFKAGMYLLETLTSGMYNEPLTIYREYIQNAVDSIDISTKNNGRSSKKIRIDLDPFNRRINILDKGYGIPTNLAMKTLCSIGSSDKTNERLRGFRGIGRLGGLAFCDKATFRTKAQNENIESIQEWDCVKLRKLMASPKESSKTLKQLFNRTTTFYTKNSKQTNGSYFEVTLNGVSSFRNYIFDIRKVKNYLSQVAPVNFNYNKFAHTNKINTILKKNLSNYNNYKIILNGEPIYKPYHDIVILSKQKNDYIHDVNLFKVVVKGTTIGYGWYGLRRDFLGSLARKEIGSGIRVRVGNILLGDEHLLDGCFKEKRFNSYLIGEIHVQTPLLMPNSRRDDFVDNDMKTLFYNAIEREIGLPISKEIRFRSKVNSEIVSKTKINPVINLKQQESNNDQIDIKKRNNKLEYSKHTLKDDYLIKIINNCEGCPNLSNILSIIEEM